MTDIDLSIIKGYAEKKKEMKTNAKKEQVIEELNKALNFFSPDELKYNNSVILFCSQIVEDLYTERSSGQIKQSIVMEVCRKYFNNDAALVASILELVYPRIIKSNFYRRNKLWIKKKLMSCLNQSPMKLETQLDISNIKL